MMKGSKIAPLECSDAPKAAAYSQRRLIDSQELFAGKREIIIDHAGSEYCLRQTSQGKLLLTK